MRIRDLFVSDVTRDIPPVVYFHEQAPEKLAVEVSEYIITGGWPKDHPNQRRIQLGIHEQYVSLLRGIADDLDKPGGPELPNAWISGFYGSGKSSFAKLLGLALDGVVLPSGVSLADAWLKRDTSPHAAELSDAWARLRSKVEPLSVVFDIGSVARDNEHIHTAAIRQVQKKLAYCSTEPLVADFELRMERDGEWPRFEQTAQEILGQSWASIKDKSLAEEDFSFVMSVMYPDRYTDPMSWYTSRGGTHTRSESPDEAVTAIRDMVHFRRPNATVFLVIDEVSQYVLSNKDRADRLRAFATALGSSLRGRAWLLALGQQKIEEATDDSFLVWVKDRFPQKLRVHLAPTNIRDVVHKRLLQKRPDAEPTLRALFEKYRPDLKLFAYGCESVTPDEFVEVYPLLPGHIDLILQLTTALRSRSTRAQGDDQAIRGLLQLLGELFRSQDLANAPLGVLVTLDKIYEVQHTALDSDVQASMARILSQCTEDADGLMVRAAKAVALLELIQDSIPTDAKLIAQCLFDRMDCGNQLPQMTEALEELRRRNLLGFSEKEGYKIQSSTGEEWERERRDMVAPTESITEIVQESLKLLLADPDRPRLQGRPFPLTGLFSDGRRIKDAVLVDPRDEATVTIDLQFLPREERAEDVWVRRSSETALFNRLVWLAGDSDTIKDAARELCRSRGMVKKYKPRRESLNPPRKLLLQQEENRAEDLERRMRDVVASAWVNGKLFFRGRPISPQEHGTVFKTILSASTTRVLADLFPHFIPTQVTPSELMQLVNPELSNRSGSSNNDDLSGLSPKFLKDAQGLAIFDVDGGRYVPTCEGVIPRRVLEQIESDGGLSGTTLLAHFGGPPYGYTANVVKACVAGLLRANRIRLQPEGGAEITSYRDVGVRDIFDKDRSFRRATIYPAGDDDIGFQARARICKFFVERLEDRFDREDHAIADAVSRHFPTLAQKLRGVLGQLNQLPGAPQGPDKLTKLGDVLEQCIRSCRQTKPTVKLIKKHLDLLRDGVHLLQMYDAELTAEAIRAVRRASDVLEYQIAQLQKMGVLASNIDAAATLIRAHLASERPWRDIASLDTDLQDARASYTSERQRLLQWQEQQVEEARARVKQRAGFETLNGDQTHKVLRPLALAATNTSSDAVAPALIDLKDPFLLALRRAEDQANETLDELLSKDDQKPLISRLDLRLKNRELSTEADVEALVDEVKTRLLDAIRAGVRIRLI